MPRASLYPGGIRRIASRPTRPVFASTPIVERFKRVGTSPVSVGGPGCPRDQACPDESSGVGALPVLEFQVRTWLHCGQIVFQTRVCS